MSRFYCYFLSTGGCVCRFFVIFAVGGSVRLLIPHPLLRAREGMHCYWILLVGGGDYNVYSSVVWVWV